MGKTEERVWKAERTEGGAERVGRTDEEQDRDLDFSR
jgi:hypothetical protein